MRRILRNRLLTVVLSICLVLVLFSAVALLTEKRTDPVSQVVNTVVYPFRKGLAYASDYFARLSAAFGDNAELREENDALRARIAELEGSLRSVSHLSEENEAMRKLLGVFGSEVEYDLAMGEIIGRGNVNWNRVFTVDLGSSDGICVYDPVITHDGLVGFVSAVFLSSCEVTCVIDSGMSCSAILSNCRATGIAEGSYDLMSNGRLKLTMLPTDTEVSVGEVVETSGLGGIFPPGLPIGSVVSTALEEDGLTRSAILRPAVELSDLTTLFIITDFTETAN